MRAISVEAGDRSISVVTAISASSGFVDLWLPIRPTDNGHLGLGADNLVALFVEQVGLAANLQVATRAGALG